jgi:guanosine-3',5'-bis(diphosphate) 3'-pyrophosphohydrolase
LERMQSTSRDAQTIKYADIIDNCREIVDHDPSFARVFLGECRTMLKKIKFGDPELYREASDLIEEKILLLSQGKKTV